MVGSLLLRQFAIRLLNKETQLLSKLLMKIVKTTKPTTTLFKTQKTYNTLSFIL